MMNKSIFIAAALALAVVGCGDATARLRTGMRVMVDGGTGNVEPG